MKKTSYVLTKTKTVKNADEKDETFRVKLLVLQFDSCVDQTDFFYYLIPYRCNFRVSIYV